MPDQALDPLRAARLPGLQGRDGEALPRLQGALPERRRRRGAAAAAVQLGDRAGRQGRSCSTRSTRRPPPRWSSWRRARASRSSPTTGRSPTRRPTSTSPSTTKAIGKAIAEIAGPAPRRRRASPRQGRRAADQRLADRRGRRPDQEGRPRGPGQPAATRRWPSSTRPTGRRRRRRSGRAARSRASATRSSASSPPTTAPAAAPSPPSRRPASNPVPPVTGNDATIAALQLIIAGDQYNTISKPSRDRRRPRRPRSPCKLLDGETPEPKTTLYNTPSELFVPAVVTPENIKAEIFDKEHQQRRGRLHRPLCRRLQGARHHSDRAIPAGRPAPAGPSSTGRHAGMTETANAATRRRADPEPARRLARTSARSRR